jgi:hypothetical protein
MKYIKLYSLLYLFLIPFHLNANLNYDESVLQQKKNELDIMRQEFQEFMQQEDLRLAEKEKALNILQDDIMQSKSELDIKIKKNQDLIDAIDGKIADKSANIFNKTKAKIAAKIFDSMMLNGEIDKVFTILIKLKAKHVAKIFKYMDENYRAVLSELLINNKGE